GFRLSWLEARCRQGPGHDKLCRGESQSKRAASSAPLLRGGKQASGANTVGVRSGRRHGQAKGLGGAPTLAAEAAIEGQAAARADEPAGRDGIACVHRLIIPRAPRARALAARALTSPCYKSNDWARRRESPQSSRRLRP